MTLCACGATVSGLVSAADQHNTVRGHDVWRSVMLNEVVQVTPLFSGYQHVPFTTAVWVHSNTCIGADAGIRTFVNGNVQYCLWSSADKH